MTARKISLFTRRMAVFLGVVGSLAGAYGLTTTKANPDTIIGVVALCLLYIALPFLLLYSLTRLLGWAIKVLFEES